MFAMLLLLCGDVHPNSGPEQRLSPYCNNIRSLVLYKDILEAENNGLT